MPTPIEHLTVAEQLLSPLNLPEAIRSQLDQNEAVRGAFFLGHIAPDVQVVSRQPRKATHFFAIPPTSRRPAYAQMLAAHPQLAQPRALPAVQAAFVVGYISHLLLDECWVREVFRPVFGPQQTWGDWRERLLLHNVLRAWLDRRGLPRLRNGIGDLLRRARPNNWLPFATDADLSRWRDLVADQFVPGADIRTVQVFADRAHVSEAEFLSLLEPEMMEERIFRRIPPAELERFHDRALDRTRDLTVRYWSGCAGTG